MSRARAPSLEERLAALGRLRDESDPARLSEGLRRALRDRSAQVVARAARLTAELQRADLASEITAALLRLLDDPTLKDPGCAAKSALAAALAELEAPEVEAFRRGIRHVQWEPVYGGRVDVAAELRGHCAVGLAGSAIPDLMNDLADLLADREPTARSGALRAIAASGRPEGPTLLRFKARIGDDDPEVLGQCFAALIALDPEGSLEVAADALKSQDDAVAGAAALALGGSRSEAALAALRDAAEELVAGGQRRVLLAAIALLRLDVALDYLLELVREAPLGAAVDAVEALAVLRHDGKLRRRVEAAVRRRGDARLEQALDRFFAK